MIASKVVGVFPRGAFEQRSALFNALEHAFPVRFVGRGAGEWGELDAAISFEPQPEPLQGVCPVLVVAGRERLGPQPVAIRFSDHETVDRRLRGQVLEEKTGTHVRHLAPGPGDVILAACADTPLWLRRAGRLPSYAVAAAPEELLETECLRDHIRSGRFVALLPLIHFLRQIVVRDAWIDPPLRAALIFDDPNLRAMSYGYLRFRELAAHATRQDYHVVMASVPLDYRFAQSEPARIFRDMASRLSVAIHGNNHEYLELLRADSDSRAMAVAAEALRRTAAFEKRSGLSVARVMFPPHEVCSDAMLEALFRLGFEGISTARLLHPARGHATPARLLAEWDPAQFVAGGLPIVPRRGFKRPLDDVVLRAFLNQPLLLFGHHQDVAEGLGFLEQAAARINALGDIHWSSLTDICRTNFALRHEGSTLRVRLFARRVAIAIPEGVAEIIVELPAVASGGEQVLLTCGSAVVSHSPSEADVTSSHFEGPFAPVVQVELRHAHMVSPEQVPSSLWPLWPIVRRGLTEGRDRIAPFRGRLGRQRFLAHRG